MKKIVSSLLLTFLLVSFIRPWSAASANSSAIKILPDRPSKIDGSLSTQLRSLQNGDMVTVIVTLRQQADVSRVNATSRAARQQETIRALQTAANISQKRLRVLLNTHIQQGKARNFKPLWIFNGFSITATADVINELAQRPEVFSISSDDLEITPALGPAEPNLTVINAPALWNQGVYGQGVVVANMDSGVDVNHPDLSSHWRGGSNSWYDPYGQHPTTPTDLSGHGTQTMGVMVGGDAGGTTVGVAPGAQWIAVKIFDDSGNSTATAIHLGFQWLLDPDSNPNTDDAPNIVNNSWTYTNPGCYLDFEPDLQALRSAGILPVFAAGNGGPTTNTSYSPANNPSAFAVGAINNSSQIYAYSSRGPTTCGGSSGPYPELVAPGVNIFTTDLYNGYYPVTGTSLASPHVAGGLALLLSAYPNLSATDQQNVLINSAIDLGVSGPDNVYGYGRLDLLATFNSLSNAPTATPTHTDTPTSTPTSILSPTNTSTPTLTYTPLPASTSTASPTPTFTVTVSPTSTSMATAAATKIHVGDIDRSVTLSGSKWNATVTIRVHNNFEQPVSNVTVAGKWSNGTTGTISCKTNSNGVCTITKSGLSSQTGSVTFTVTNLIRSPLLYMQSSNHDPDGDSTGTSIVITKP